MPITEAAARRRRLATAPFGIWTYSDAKKAVEERIAKDGYEIRKDYAIHHDHLRGGKEWVGPGDASTSDAIKKQFAPEDAIGEVLYNVSNAFSEPQLGAAPLKETPAGQQVPAETTQKMAEALALLTSWWDKRKLQELIQERQRVAAWAGVAGLRLWIPWRFYDVEGEGLDRRIFVREVSDWDEALAFLHVMSPLPEYCTIVTDPATQDKCAIFLDKEIIYDGKGGKEERPRAELVFLDPQRDTDEEGETVQRVVYSDDRIQPLEARFKLGGRLTFSEMENRVLITDPVLRTQRQLNLLTTILTRLGETAAFRERYTKNAKPQGIRYLYDEAAGEPLADGAFLERDDEGRTWAVVPQPRTLGANTTTELIGLPQYDEQGNQKGNQMPDVVVVDPADPKPWIEAADATRRRILRMCAQGHLGGISNAEASGIAYEQARAVFEKDLNGRRVTEEGMLRNLFTSVLAFAELITGKVGYFTNTIRITVDQRVDAGPRSPDLVRLDLEALEAGALSKETTMARMGVEDVEAEMMRVRQSAAHILDLIESATNASNAFEPESLIAVLKELNVPTEVINALVAKKEPEPVTKPGPAPEE